MVFEEERVFKMIDMPTLRQLVQENKSDEVILDYIANNFDADEKPVNSITASYKIFVDKMNELFGRKFRVTPQMVAKFKTRLKKFTFEEIMTAMENMSKSRFYHGENDRGWTADPEYFLRTDAQIDKFLNNAPVIKKDFEQPTKQLEEELILYAELATGGDRDYIAEKYHKMVQWMQNRNEFIEFDKEKNRLVAWLLKDGVTANPIFNSEIARHYRAYIYTCGKKGILPKVEIEKLGLLLEEKLS